jgi:hypothetical protein
MKDAIAENFEDEQSDQQDSEVSQDTEEEVEVSEQEETEEVSEENSEDALQEVDLDALDESEDGEVDEEPVEPEVVEDSEEEEANARVSRIRHVRDKIKDANFQLSREIYHFQKKDLYVHVKNPATGEFYSSFKEFADNELPYSYRKAKYLSDNWEYYVNGIGDGDESFYRKVLEELSITKANMLNGWVSSDGIHEWIEEAKGLSVRELEDYLDELESDEDDEVSKEPSPEGVEKQKGTKLSFEVDEGEESIINEAAKVVKEITGRESISMGEVVAHIAGEFMSQHGGDIGAETKSRMYQSFEQSTGERLIAIDFNAQEIKYGHSNMQSLIDMLDSQNSDEESSDDDAVEQF